MNLLYVYKWKKNLSEYFQYQSHKQAVVCGDAYVCASIAWPFILIVCVLIYFCIHFRLYASTCATDTQRCGQTVFCLFIFYFLLCYYIHIFVWIEMGNHCVPLRPLLVHRFYLITQLMLSHLAHQSVCACESIWCWIATYT